ncbi:capsid protein [Crucivirus-122]|nr:capsid protein [Crucivirus-122]
MPGKKKSYTQAEKLAYYKRKAAMNYTGRGAYRMRKPAPKSRAVGEAAGAALGGMVKYIPGGAPFAAPAAILASKLGGYLGNKIGSYMGFGEYTVKNNSLVIPEGNSPGQMHSDGKRTRICHREYITDIISSGTTGQFRLQSFQMQPGNNLIFPWLSSVALSFQKYKVHGAIVEFKSGSGDAINGTNTALGEVIISSNYNCADSNFVNRMQMENTQYCSSAKPSVSFVHIIECDPSLQAQETLYVSPSLVPQAGLGINDINFVNVQVATVGVQGTNVNLGSLYITYDIELIQPLQDYIDKYPKSDWFAPTLATVSAANPCGTSNVPDNRNSLGGTLSGATYIFPPLLQEGLFKFQWYAIGTAAVFTAPGVTLTNCVIRATMGGDVVGALAFPQNGANATNVCLIYVIEVTGQNASFVINSGGTIPTAVTGAALMVDQVDRDLFGV